MEELQRLLMRICEFREVGSQVFKTIGEKKDNIKMSLTEVLLEIKTIYDVQERLTAMESAQKDAASNAEKNSQYVTKTDMVKTRIVDTDWLNTLCLQHMGEKCCHEKCGLNQLSDGEEGFGRCKCMGGGQNCTVCGCPPINHVHRKQMAQQYTESVTKILEDMKKDFKTYSDQDAKLTKDISQYQQDMRMLKRALIHKEGQIKQYCRDLKALCEDFNFVAEMQASISSMEADARTIRSNQGRKDADDMICRVKTLVNDLTEPGETKNPPGGHPSSAGSVRKNAASIVKDFFGKKL